MCAALTRTGYEGIGIELDMNSFTTLRDRLHVLSRLTLRFAPEALAAMHDPDRFVPLHMLRLAIRLGVRSPCASGVPGVCHYRAPMTRRWVPLWVHLSIQEDDSTLLRLGFGTGHSPLCERC